MSGRPVGVSVGDSAGRRRPDAPCDFGQLVATAEHMLYSQRESCVSTPRSGCTVSQELDARYAEAHVCLL